MNKKKEDLFFKYLREDLKPYAKQSDCCDDIVKQRKEIERLNNIINKIKSILHNSIEYNALTKIALIVESLQGVDKE